MEKPNTKRELLKAVLALPLVTAYLFQGISSALATTAKKSPRLARRVRPGDVGWPTDKLWQELQKKLKGQLIKLQSPFSQCNVSPSSSSCEELLQSIKNPFYIGDQPALTQTSGWVDAWQSQPSVYAVEVASASDVALAINFAREHNVRLVVKGGGHSYLGTSSAPDSLLIWTRAMHKVSMSEAFVPQGGRGKIAPQPVVIVGAGALWSDVYAEVTTRGGRYVQGGGCTTVGVAGLVQSGGFSNFSKNFGTAAGNLLEVEVVTADGVVRVANAFNNPDLFWAIKGGGGGSFGVVTQLTLRTYPLPEFFGAVIGEIKAATSIAYRALIAKFIEFYQADLFNPHWGETVSFRNGDTLNISLVFQGLNKLQVDNLWQPFLEWVYVRKEYSLNNPLKVLEIPARHFWDPEYFRQYFPDVLISDDRPQASPDHMAWKGDTEQAGWFIYGYQSVWMPANLLGKDQQSQLVDALFAASQCWDCQLHFNKGLAGAPQEALDGARDTAMNPAVLNAFALAIVAGGGSPAYPGMPATAEDKTKARASAKQIHKATQELLKVVPDASAYVSESDYFQANWQTAYWGNHYSRLASVKQLYDPEGLFFVHHGVGSEYWSDDGFNRK